jgi:hypothetical protein
MRSPLAKTWLQLIAILHIIGGLSLPAVIETGVFDLYVSLNSALAHFLHAGLAGSERTPFQVGLFGPTLASWGILFLFGVQAAFDKPTRAAWWSLCLAVLVWAPYDSLLSWREGIYVNILVDLLVFVSILVPLLAVRRHFFARNPDR